MRLGGVLNDLSKHFAAQSLSRYVGGASIVAADRQWQYLGAISAPLAAVFRDTQSMTNK